MAAARQVLERSTLMLLVASKTSLRHPDCIHSKENRDTVFCQMRRAMDLIHYVVKDGILSAAAANERRSRAQQQILEWDTDRSTASSNLRYFARLMEGSRPRFTTSGILTTSKSTLKDISSSSRGVDGLQTRESDDISERRELMRSNSERDRHMTNHHSPHTSTSSQHQYHHHSHQKAATSSTSSQWPSSSLSHQSKYGKCWHILRLNRVVQKYCNTLFRFCKLTCR